MITLYQYYPAFGIPSGSPFCVKAETLLKMSGVDYKVQSTNDPRKAPRGKLPYIADDGVIVADSEHIRIHLETKYNADFDGRLTDHDRAIGHGFARMAEERLYWVVVYSRWIEDENWPCVRDKFFGSVPALIRPLVTGKVRKSVCTDLHSHGLGRHTAAEIYKLGAADLEAIAAQLDFNDYFMGDEVCGFDATIYPFLSAILLSSLDSPLKRAAEIHETFRPYIARMQERFFPAFKPEDLG